jgi:hypothetical protein
VEDVVLEIFPENAGAVRLFLKLATQWRTEALSTLGSATIIRTGLDYGVVEPTARMSGLAMDEGLLGQLQVLEAAALSAWSKERQARK